MSILILLPYYLPVGNKFEFRSLPWDLTIIKISKSLI